jgi:hypothetical protein
MVVPPWATSRSDAAHQRRIGGDAGIAVGAAALHADHQMFEPCRRARDPVGLGCHFPELSDAALDGLAGAAGLLDGHVAEIAVLAHPAPANQVRHLHDLAAKAQEQDAGEVRIAGIALQGAEQGVVTLVIARHAAAGAMDDRHDTVDILELVEPALFLHSLGNEAGDGARAVHGGENAEIVAGADRAVSPVIAHEVTLFRRRGKRQDLGREFLRLGVATHTQIMDMNVLARRNHAGGNADGLTVAEHLLTFGNRAYRNLVSARHRFGERYIEPGHHRAAGQVLEGNDHIVGCIETNCLGDISCHRSERFVVAKPDRDRISGRIVA